MAGIAKVGLLKIRGLAAIAIAIAAFCIPTSTTIVRLSSDLKCTTLDNIDDTEIDKIIRAVTANPKFSKLSKISVRCSIKKTEAKSTRQGKAILDRKRCILFAKFSLKAFKIRPKLIGTIIKTKFCIKSFNTGNSKFASESFAKSKAKFTAKGRVKIEITVLIVVNETDKATSPPQRRENIFDELPPGQQAIKIRPNNKTSGRFK